ncbi:MAG: Serine acetyltransferase-like protein [Spirosoma sp.]|nr:Serine acetyltransferase-like protein [Spirosoma sp.]
MKLIKAFKFFYGFTFCLPHLLLFLVHKNRPVIEADIRHWLSVHHKNYSTSFGLIYLLSHFPEYRNLFYYRIGHTKYILNLWCWQVPSLVINAEEVGEGLYIQHGHSTRIGAKSIGINCWINQQVTIGWEQKGRPIILDNVRVGAGAKIIGKVVVGNNCVIGANAVIVKDVPDNCTVVGIYPVYIVRRNGERVKELL